MILTTIVAFIALFAWADAECQVPAAKFWASANKAVGTYFKNTGNRAGAAEAKKKFVEFKKDDAMRVKKVKCGTAGKSEASASFAADSPDATKADIGSSMIVQTNQNNWCLTSKNKGIDYGFPEVQAAMANCFFVLERFATEANFATASIDGITAISTTITTETSELITISNVYEFKTVKFIVMGMKAQIIFYKMLYGNKKNPDITYDSAKYKAGSSAAKGLAKQLKIDWKGTSVAEMSTGDAWGASVWFAQIDITSIAVGIKYYQIYYLWEVQNYMLTCFDWFASLSATASPTASSIALIATQRADVLIICFNLGLLVTTYREATNITSTGNTGTTAGGGCCYCPGSSSSYSTSPWNFCFRMAAAAWRTTGTMILASPGTVKTSSMPWTSASQTLETSTAETTPGGQGSTSNSAWGSSSTHCYTYHWNSMAYSFSTCGTCPPSVC